MNKRAFTKRILTVALSIIMVVGLVPMTVFAADYTFTPTTQSGNNTSAIQYSMTDENAGDFTLTQNNQRIELVLMLDEGWYFEKWDTYFDGYKDVAILTDPKIEGVNPKSDDGAYTFFNQSGDVPIYDEEGPSNNSYYSGTRVENWEKDIWVRIHTPYYGRHTITAVLKPILTVNAGDGIDYQIATNSPSYRYLAENQAAVKYGDNATVTYSVDNKYVVTGVSANYNTNYSENGTVVTVNSIKKPATVTIRTRLKQHNIVFDANGGGGTMSAQVFEHSVAQTLTENNFTKTGYTFTGWNTKADGTGTSYIDKQSVTFTHVNDGESIALYAQWKACRNHQWVDGECTECGTLCSHSGGNATCSEQATCSECGIKYGDLGKHKHVYTASENIITETCDNNCGHNKTATITAPAGELVYDGTEKNATVSYSNGWQGGELTVTYSDGGNINAGKETASIEKGGVKASVDYTIEKNIPNYTVPLGLTATYGQTLANIVLPEDWTWDDPTTSVGDAGTNSFKAIFTPADTTNYNTVIADVDVTVDKAVITITVDNKTAKQCEGLPQFTFTATGLIQGETLIADPTISTQADMKSAGTFEIIATGADAGDNYTITYVPGTLTVEAHTEHSGGIATCTEKAVCTLCNRPYGETLSHTYSTDWKQDGTNHWHECSCGAKAEVAVHSGGTATCTDKAVCTVCGISHGECAAHPYENGKCTVCSEVNPNHVPKTSSPQTGDDSNLWIWVVLLFVSGGAVITLTVVDKKRRTVVNK